MLNPTAFENSRPDGVSVLEIVPDPEEEVGRPRRFVPLRRTGLSGAINGPLASLRLRQVYRFCRDQCDRVLEAVYRFPLPGDAAVTGVRVRFGEAEIRADLKERRRAEETYEEAKQQGRQAALLTRESPDVFTLQVAGIQPDQEVTVETDYVQLARADGPGWTLRVPLTTAPRYVRGDEASSRPAAGQPLLLLRDPGHRFALDLTLAGGTQVHSPTHELEQTPEDGRLRLRLKQGEVLPDRDCVLSWRPAQEPECPALQVTLYDDTASGQLYFLALLAPPARAPAAPVSREVVLLVDHSGSMEGPKWEAADWAVKQFLGGLGERDTFALGLFHNTTTWLAKGPQSASAKAVTKAVQFLDQHKDSGGTELGVALEQALDLKRGGGEAARHVLLITDAEVTDAGRILRLADEETRQQPRRRIDVLCIDAAPNSFLAHELAERGGGVARFLTSSPEEEDITTALDEVLADWAQPVVAGLRLQVSGGPVETAGRALLAGKDGGIDLGDLPAGRSLWVIGRLPRLNGKGERGKGKGDISPSAFPLSNLGEASELSFRVVTPAQREVAGCRVSTKPAAPARAPAAIKALFGARRILGLEFLIHSGYSGEELSDQLARLGYDPKEILADRPKKKGKVYAENVRADAGDLLRRLLMRESLEYGLACSETAFVAVRSEKGQPVGETVVVANALPEGWSEAFAGGRGGFAVTSLLACSMAPPAAAAPAAPMALDRAMFGDALGDSGAPSPPLAFRLQKAKAAVPASGTAPAGAGPLARGNSLVVFSGVPQWENGEALLFDSEQGGDTGHLPEGMRLVRLQVDFPGGSPQAASLNSQLTVLLFVEDLAAPRARVRLGDLVRHGGGRPLNVRREAGQRVRLVLADPAGSWAGGAPAMQVSLHWA
jgi:Ca-activated chloride channel family protein